MVYLGREQDGINEGKMEESRGKQQRRRDEGGRMKGCTGGNQGRIEEADEERRVIESSSLDGGREENLGERTLLPGSLKRRETLGITSSDRMMMEEKEKH